MSKFEMPNNNDLLVRARMAHEERAIQNAALVVDAALHAFVQWDYGNKPSPKQYPWIDGWTLVDHHLVLAEVGTCLAGHPFRAQAIVVTGDRAVDPEVHGRLLKRLEAIAYATALEAYRIYGEPRTAWPKWHKVTGGDERWQTHDEWLLHGVRACTGRAALIGGAACGALLDYAIDPTLGTEALFAQVACCMRMDQGAESAYDLYRSARWPEEILPALDTLSVVQWAHWAVLYAVTRMIMAIDGVHIVGTRPTDDEPTRTDQIRRIWELNEEAAQAALVDTVVSADQSRTCSWCAAPRGEPCWTPHRKGHLSGRVHTARLAPTRRLEDPQ